MSGWMKKTFTAEGVTEWPPGPCMEDLKALYGQSGAVMLLLDVSGSMRHTIAAGGTRIKHAIRGCEGFIDEAVAGGYEVGLMLWSHQIEGHAVPSKDGSTARKLLSKAQPVGGNNVVPALRQAGSILMDTGADDKVIAIFGDGDLGDEKEAKLEADRWAARGIRIITLGLGDQSADALSKIATEPAAAVARTTNEVTLEADIKSMARGLMGARRKR